MSFRLLMLFTLGLLTAGSVAAIEAGELFTAFREDRNGATKEYKGQSVSVSGKVTAVRRESRGLQFVLDNQVLVFVDERKTPEVATAVKASMEEAEEAAETRADKAKAWKKRYEQAARKRAGKNQGTGGRKRPPYKDEKNPFGSTDGSAELEMQASGECDGMRGSYVYMIAESCQIHPSNKGKGKGKGKGK